MGSTGDDSVHRGDEDALRRFVAGWVMAAAAILAATASLSRYVPAGDHAMGTAFAADRSVMERRLPVHHAAATLGCVPLDRDRMRQPRCEGHASCEAINAREDIQPKRENSRQSHPKLACSAPYAEEV